MPVKAGNTIAKTRMNESGESTRAKMREGSAVAEGSGEPSHSMMIETARSATTAHRAWMPIRAPRENTRMPSATVLGTETKRASKAIPVTSVNHGPSGWKAIPNAIM